MARKRIAGGEYFCAPVENVTAHRRVLSAILKELDACPVGDGAAYRDLVAEFLVESLREVVDGQLVQIEFGFEGGRGDIELPLRIEAIDKHGLWNRWAERYRIRSILVECKNEVKAADVDAVRQISGDLDVAGRGQFGILVARNGFTRSAKRRMSAICRQGHQLILPLSHSDFREFRKAQRVSMVAAMEYLRRKETLQIQGS